MCSSTLLETCSWVSFFTGQVPSSLAASLCNNLGFFSQNPTLAGPLGFSLSESDSVLELVGSEGSYTSGFTEVSLLWGLRRNVCLPCCFFGSPCCVGSRGLGPASLRACHELPLALMRKLTEDDDDEDDEAPE